MEQVIKTIKLFPKLQDGKENFYKDSKFENHNDVYAFFEIGDGAGSGTTKEYYKQVFLTIFFEENKDLIIKEKRLYDMIVKSKYNKKLSKLESQDDEMQIVTKILLNNEYYDYGVWKKINQELLEITEFENITNLIDFSNSIISKINKSILIYALKEIGHEFCVSCKAYKDQYERNYYVITKLLNLCINIEESAKIIKKKLNMIKIDPNMFKLNTYLDIQKFRWEFVKINTVLYKDYSSIFINDIENKKTIINEIFKVIDNIGE